MGGYKPSQSTSACQHRTGYPPWHDTEPPREQPQCALTAALLVCNWLRHLTWLEKGTDVAVNNTSVECRICGESAVFLPNARRAPIGEHVCYSSIKCRKQPPYRINKQGGIADIRPGCCVALLLAELFSP